MGKRTTTDFTLRLEIKEASQEIQARRQEREQQLRPHFARLRQLKVYAGHTGQEIRLIIGLFIHHLRRMRKSYGCTGHFGHTIADQVTLLQVLLIPQLGDGL